MELRVLPWGQPLLSWPWGELTELWTLEHLFYVSCSLPDLAIKLPSGSLKSSTTSRATNRVPAIVGGVLGGIAVILFVFLYLRQRRGKVEEDQDFPVTPFTSEFNHSRPSLISPKMRLVLCLRLSVDRRN